MGIIENNWKSENFPFHFILIHQLSSASLVQKVVSTADGPNTAVHHSTANANGQKSQMPISLTPSAPFPALKRKEFPSYQRQRVPIPPQKCVHSPPTSMTQQQKAPPPPSIVLRRTDPAEEVEEFSKVARKQMAILGVAKIRESDNEK